MQYELYTLPTCMKCKQAEELLNKLDVEGKILSLAEPNNLQQFRINSSSVRKYLKRESGSYVLPIVLLFNDGKDVELVQGLEAVVEWTSRQ